MAYIDPNKCKSCRKCEEVCPQGTIIALNFPPRKPKAEGEAVAPKVAEPVKKVAEAAKKPVETPAKPAEAPKKTAETSKASETAAPKTEA